MPHVIPGGATTQPDPASEIDLSRWRMVAMAGSKDPNPKILLLFVSQRGAVDFVAKLPVTSAAAKAVAREAGVLRALRTNTLGNLASTIPNVKGVASFHGRRSLVMEGLPGTPMLILYHRAGRSGHPNDAQADFQATGEWLAGFQRATAQAEAPMHIGPEVDVLRHRFGGEPGLEDTLQRLTVIQAVARADWVRQTAVHGDFWCGNILCCAGRVTGVVDWEHGAATGDPVRDAARFAITYALYLDRHTRPGRPVAGHAGLTAGKWGAGVEYALRGSGWFPRLFRSFVEGALERLGAPPSLWRIVVLAGLAEIAASADDLEFGRKHLQLFDALSRGGVACKLSP